MLVLITAEDLLGEIFNNIPLFGFHEHFDEVEQLQIIISSSAFQLDGPADVHGNDTVSFLLIKVLVAQALYFSFLFLVHLRDVLVQFLEAACCIGSYGASSPLLFFQQVFDLLESHGFLQTYLSKSKT